MAALAYMYAEYLIAVQIEHIVFRTYCKSFKEKTINNMILETPSSCSFYLKKLIGIVTNISKEYDSQPISITKLHPNRNRS